MKRETAWLVILAIFVSSAMAASGAVAEEAAAGGTWEKATAGSMEIREAAGREKISIPTARPESEEAKGNLWNRSVHALAQTVYHSADAGVRVGSWTVDTIVRITQYLGEGIYRVLTCWHRR